MCLDSANDHGFGLAMVCDYSDAIKGIRVVKDHFGECLATQKDVAGKCRSGCDGGSFGSG